jgi:hypothetical protein
LGSGFEFVAYRAEADEVVDFGSSVPVVTDGDDVVDLEPFSGSALDALVAVELSA